MDVPEYVRGRIRQSPPFGTPVIPGTPPIVCFGDAKQAEVATLGLNPSDKEYLDGSGKELTGDNRRFETVESLEVESLEKASDEATFRAHLARRARDLDEPEQPNRARREVLRIVRDLTYSRTVKKENDYECQVCGETLRLANGDRYAEAHHVHPLGEGGKDTPANIMCVCPNHHALLDYGAIPLDSEEIDGVGSKYIEYHNGQIFEAE